MIALLAVSKPITTAANRVATTPVASPEEHAAASALVLVLLVALGLFGLCIYFVPAFVAFQRGHENAPAIAVLNVLLGWSFIGWAIAMVWAFTGEGKSRGRKRRYRSEPEPPDLEWGG